MQPLWIGCNKTVDLVSPTPPTQLGQPVQPTSEAGLVDTRNRIATQAVVNLGPPPAGPPPFVEARIYAMTFIAMHDGLNATFRRFRPYALDTTATGTSPDAAVASAAHDVLVALVPPQATFVDSAYTAALAHIADGSAKTNGITLGRRAAAVILERRASDGSDHAQGPYVPGTAPGAYQFTPPFDGPPFNGFVDSPLWGKVTPFALISGSQFRPPAPYAVTSTEYAADLMKIEALGSAASTVRTAEQTQVALFWAENSPLGWNRVARAAATQRNLDDWDKARLYALMQIAEADAYIASLDAKYYYNFWRPITAVRLADTDGNPATPADAAWEPLVVTPPVPDYPSAHAAAGGAGAEVLRQFFGADNIAFTTTSTSLPGVTRRFTSFSGACDENGVSRIYIGFRFRLAVDRGKAQGRAVGAYVMQNALRDHLAPPSRER